MENKESELRVFQHKGQMCYSFKGHFISCADYGYYKSLGYDRDTIMFEHSKAFSDLFRQDDERRWREENYPAIHNVKELAGYIFTLLPEKTVAEIKAKREECKTITDVINLFPGIYHNILRLRYALDEKIAVNKRLEMESLEKTITHSLPAVYNPDAFIGEA